MTNVQNNLKHSRHWNANWIWADHGAEEPNSYWLFRREMALTDIPDKAMAYISADTRYQLYINGTLVGRGVPQSAPYLQYYDTRNIARHLEPGDNCLAVIVNYVGNLPASRGGLLLAITEGPDSASILTTDESWAVTRCTAWKQNTHFYSFNKRTPYQEVFDIRQMPDGWTKVGFNDSDWEQAEVIQGPNCATPPTAGPWSRLIPRDIPFMTADPTLPDEITYTEECLSLDNRSRPEDLSVALSATGKPLDHSTIKNPENLCRKSGTTTVCCSTKHQDGVFDGIYDPCVVIDFGRVITAYPRLEIDGIDDGRVEIGYAERLVDGHFNNAIDGPFVDQYTMTNGPQIYQPFTWKSFRYLKLRFRSCQSPVHIQSLQAIISTYPYDERGSFESDDETLNDVWDISRRTLRLCSNEFLMDTPWREQAQWLGDVAAVTLGGIYSCFGDVKLTGKFIRQSGNNLLPNGLLSCISNTAPEGWQTCIPDYSLWWVMALWNHYNYTGQKQWIDRFYPVVLRIMQTHLDHVNAHGLLEDMPHGALIDWADIDRRGECTALNAIFCGALKAAGKIASERGDARAVETMITAQTELQNSFQ